MKISKIYKFEGQRFAYTKLARTIQELDTVLQT